MSPAYNLQLHNYLSFKIYEQVVSGWVHCTQRVAHTCTCRCYTILCGGHSTSQSGKCNNLSFLDCSDPADHVVFTPVGRKRKFAIPGSEERKRRHCGDTQMMNWKDSRSKDDSAFRKLLDGPTTLEREHNRKEQGLRPTWPPKRIQQTSCYKLWVTWSR